MFAFFERLISPFPDEPAGPPPARLLAFAWHYARHFRGLLIATATLSAVIAVVEVAMFAFLGNLVDWLATADPETVWQDHGLALLGMAVLVLIAYPGLAILGDMVMHQGLLGNFAMTVRWKAHRALLRQSLGFFQDEFAGRLATKVMQTALAVRDSVVQLLDRITYITIYLIAALFLFAGSDIRLTAPLLLWVVGYIGAIVYFMPRLRERSRVQADARALMTGRIVDSYTNIPTIKLFAHAAREEAYAREGMEQFLGTVYRQMRVVTWVTGTLYTLNALLLAGVAGLAIWLWQVGSVTTGAIAVAIGLTLRLHAMSQWILWEVAQLSENIGVAQDGMGTLATPITVKDQPDARSLAVTRGEVRFENVTFHYGKGGGVVEDLSLAIRPGEKVGLVGRSGAGKSTLVNLLLRLYDVEGGRVLVDGQDVRDVTQESLRGAISVVTQDTSLLHRSIADNVAYGRPEATWADVEWAIREAKADEFVAGLRDAQGRTGLDAHVGERGVRLSGGQRQRIAIARVLLKDAPILVLDEATSALDSEVESAIQDSLFRLMEGKTVIAIAHRLSTIAALDRLVVMDAGRIVEQGTHRELLARGGLYTRLWERQSGGFLDVGEGSHRTAGGGVTEGESAR